MGKKQGTRSNPIKMRHQCECGRFIEIDIVASGAGWGFWHVTRCIKCGYTVGNPHLMDLLKKEGVLDAQADDAGAEGDAVRQHGRRDDRPAQAEVGEG